jgi:hypothetical protein
MRPRKQARRSGADMGDFFERCFSAAAEGSVLKGDGRRLGPPLITSGPVRNPRPVAVRACEFPGALIRSRIHRPPRRRVMEVGARHCRGPGDGCRVTEEAARGAVVGGQFGVLGPGRARAGEHMRRPGARVVAGSAHHCGGPGDCHRVPEEVTPAPSVLLPNVILLPARVWAAGTRR